MRNPLRLPWRIRLSTMMLLVVIAALATYIVVDRWQRAQEVRRLAAQAQPRRERTESNRRTTHSWILTAERTTRPAVAATWPPGGCRTAARGAPSAERTTR